MDKQDKKNKVEQDVEKEVQTENTENVETEEKDESPNQNPLERENSELKKQVEEFKDKWMRNVAEFDNYKKRNAKLWQDAFSEGVFQTVLKVLPIGDNLDRALTMGLDEKTAEGIKNLKRSFDEILTNMGIQEINPVGEKFDPNISEAVMQVEDESLESETVKQVFEKGYKLNEKIIRYAKVSVVK